jgi:hypothetical protein
MKPHYENIEFFLQLIKFCLITGSLSIALIFNACDDDNPITINTANQLDSPRYYWKVDTLQATFIRDIWGLDTNNVYFLSPSYLIHYSDSKYTYIPMPNISARCIRGVDKNNIFIGGSGLSPYNSKLLKYDGIGFEEFIANDTFHQYPDIDFEYVNNNNDIWLGCHNGIVYHFDGLIFQEYYIDSTYEIGHFFKDQQNSLFFSADLRPNGGHDTSAARVRIYKLQNNNWRLLDSSVYTNGLYILIPRNTSDQEILAVNINGFYKYNAPGYSKIIDIKGFGIDISWAGISSSNIASIGSLIPSPDGGHTIFTWNGSKWSNENLSHDPSYNFMQSANIQNRYYFSVSDLDFYHNTLIFTNTKLK